MQILRLGIICDFICSALQISGIFESEMTCFSSSRSLINPPYTKYGTLLILGKTAFLAQVWCPINSSCCLFQTDWAPGKSVKDQNLNEYWNKDIGVTYIPWSKLPNDLTSLTDGGFIDDDTVPEDMRGDYFGDLLCFHDVLKRHKAQGNSITVLFSLESTLIL